MRLDVNPISRIRAARDQRSNEQWTVSLDGEISLLHAFNLVWSSRVYCVSWCMLYLSYRRLPASLAITLADKHTCTSCPSRPCLTAPDSLSAPKWPRNCDSPSAAAPARSLPRSRAIPRSPGCHTEETRDSAPTRNTRKPLTYRASSSRN